MAKMTYVAAVRHHMVEGYRHNQHRHSVNVNLYASVESAEADCWGEPVTLLTYDVEATEYERILREHWVRQAEFFETPE